MEIDKFVDQWYGLRPSWRGVMYVLFAVVVSYTVKYLDAFLVKTGYRTSGWQVLVFVATLTFVKLFSAIMKDRKKQKELAIRDALTGLYNPRFLINDCQMMIAKASRYGEKICLCFVDLDRFKKINDQYGHSVGDKVLIFFANHLANTVRSGDLIIRKGGDEFIIIWTTTDMDKTDEFLTRLQRAMSSIFYRQGTIEIKFSASIGFCHGNAFEKNIIESLLAKSNEIMYQYKEVNR